MSRSKTTQIPRPAPRGSDDGHRSRLGDLTRPIPIERRVSRRPKVALATTAAALAVIGTLAAIVFVLPVGTWRDQDTKLERLEAQYDELSRVNGELQVEVDRLGTDDGVREAAREEISYVELGEQRITVEDFPLLSTELPSGWPYSVVTSMIEARRGGAGTAPTD